MDLGLIKKVSARKKIKLEDLAAKANIKRATFFNYLSGKTSIPASVLKKLSDILDIPIAYLYDEYNYLELSESNEPLGNYSKNNHVSMIPLIHKYVHAEFIESSDDSEFINKLPKFPVLVDETVKGRYFCFELNGDSMTDGTHESRLSGDIVLSREINESQWNDSLASAQRNVIIVHKTDGVLMKRIISHDVKEGKIKLHSLNAQHEDTEIKLDEILGIFAELKLVERIS